MSLGNIYFVLVRPQIGENIGSVARAIKNFNIKNLRIVNPRCNWPNQKALSTSVGDKEILKSYEILKSKNLLKKDLNKINDIKLNKIKNLVNNFQILEESYRKDEYKAIFKIFYNDIKVKKFLGQKNISFSQPKNISAVFFPILFINEELQTFDENFFYKNWSDVEIKNELINSW